MVGTPSTSTTAVVAPADPSGEKPAMTKQQRKRHRKYQLKKQQHKQAASPVAPVTASQP